MFRSSKQDTSARAFQQLARATIVKANDGPQAQELHVEIMKGETKKEVEHWHPYGLSTVPLPPSGNKRAEAVVAFLGGHRSHAVVLGTMDRRHRPKGMAEGEVQLHDDQGQKVHITRGGINITGTSAKPVTVTAGNANIKIENGKVTASVGGLQIILTATRVDLGGPGGPAVVTTGGPSSKVFAIV